MAKSIKQQAREAMAANQARDLMKNSKGQRILDLQEEYKAFTKQKALEEQYNKWAAKQDKKKAKEEAKAAAAEEKNKKEIPSLKFMTAEERKQYKKDTTVKDPIGSIDEDKSYANTYGKKRLETKAEREGRKKEVAARNEARQIEQERQREQKKNSIKDRTLRGNSLNEYAKSDMAKAEKTEDQKLLEVLKAYADKNGITLDEAKRRYNNRNQTITKADNSKINKELTAETKAKEDEVKRLAAQKKQTPYEAFTGSAAKAVYDIANGPVLLAGKLAGKDWDLIPEATREQIKQASEQHPFASGAGTMAGMASGAFLAGGGVGGRALLPGTANAGQAFTAGYGDALLNGAAKSQAIANGLGTGARQLGANVLRDMPIDVVTDIIPTLANDVAEGKTKEEIAKNTLANIGINAAFNGLGDIIPSLGAINATKRTVKGLDQADEVVKNATRQANEAAETIEQLAKQIPPVEDDIKAEIPKADLPDINAERALFDEIDDLNKEMSTAWETPAKNATEEIENAAKTQQPKLALPDDISEQIASDLLEIRDASEAMRIAAEATGNSKAIEKYNRLANAIEDYEKALYYSEDLGEVNKAKKATDAARQALYREIKKTNPSYKGDLTGTKIGQAEYRRTLPGLKQQEVEELANSFIESENALENNKYVRDALPDTKIQNNVPGAEKLQFFAEGENPKGKWKTSKVRTNTFNNTGWLKNQNDLPEKDYAYRVFSEAEQRSAAAERYADSANVVNDLLHTDQFDEVDVKAAMGELNRLLDEGTEDSLREARRLGTKIAHEGREGGRTVQAFAEYNKDSAAGALSDANRAQEELIDSWKSRNVKKREGNSRIAKALADMGNKWKNKKVTPELTHDQIKKGVIAEIEREVGSVETHFNDNDIEFLTTLAEDKSIPVWKITSEIEHKLNTGEWYTLDESIDIPKPTNTKLQNALNSLLDNGARAEKEAPTLKEIAEEVRNTLGKESADYEGLFTDDDMDYLANLIHNGASKEELAEALNTKMATGSFGISDETLREVNNIFKLIQNYDPDSKQFVEGQAEAYRLLANEILKDATAFEKFEAWRYIAMLGNPKTMLRNYIGNQTFAAVTGISNNLAALGEAGVDKAVKAVGGEGIQRTKAVLNPISDNALIKAAAEDADASRYRQIIGSKYEKFSKDSLRQHKSVFNNKLLQLYEKVTDAGISDYKAVKNKFSTSLAGYLKANGYDQSIFNAETELTRLKNLSETQLLSNADKQTMEKLTKEVAALDKARDYALKQAEYATFHEDNAVATALTRASSFLRNSDSKVLNAGGAMLEGVVPFKKTPANVLRSGLEYSPLGAIDSLKKTGKLIYENTGKRAGNLADTYINSKGKEVAKTFAHDVIDSWSKTLTGSGLTALGFYLYDKGALLDSDKETKYQDQLEGLQNYSIKLNDKTYTLDWAAPSVMPLLLGAEIAKVWNASGNEVENWYDHLDEYLNAANRIADPIVETSMLSGIKDTLETAANAAKYDENLNIPTLLAYNTLTGYATQAIPTASGQIARTIDNTRRSTYSDKEGVAGTLEKQGRKLMNKIPGLSQLNEPYIDTYGREQTNSPFNNTAGNLVYQMLSPGYLANVNTTDADKISREVYEASGGDENVLAKWKSYVKMNEKRVSPEDYTNYARVYGQTQYDVRNALANDEWFNSLDDAAKTDIINDINTMADHVGKASLDPEYTTGSKPYVAYSEGGIEGLLDYYKGQHDKDVAKGLLGDSGVQMNSNAAKAVVAAVSEGNMEEAEKLANQAAADKAAGKSTTSSGSYDTGDYGVAGVRKSTTTEAIYAKSGLNGLKQYKSFQDDFGSNASDAYKRYENAKTVIPGLSAATYRSNYKRIDSYGDSNGSVTQKELLSYLNDGDYSESEALDLWAAYGNAWAKTVVYQNGQWVAKKQK